ncbi:MAG: TlyA family RNA methyltransferase [Acholeplasmataceae bacterium]|jgi:23S rRNA (cytidine1920-2'-O)/16S rRNA (cytidine1409-2'-O)-methyltransferase|nr:TlyA family RNA methyltransferase [Acholeplasmataceae bacterium]
MRLDHFLLEQDYVKTRSQATDLIKRGLISVNGEIVTKAGYDVKSPVIKILKQDHFVSRAGEKLKGAILDFKIDFRDKIVIDIGASTGGFTDCALTYGAKHVYTYDVGSDQLDQKLASDHRVTKHENTNILDVQLPDADIILIDVSFTSILPIMKHLKGFPKEMVCLIKPQYEAGHMFFKQGVLKDLKIHEKILNERLLEMKHLGFSLFGLKKSHLKGKQGNQEYILYIKPHKNEESINQMVRGVLC